MKVIFLLYHHWLGSTSVQINQVANFFPEAKGMTRFCAKTKICHCDRIHELSKLKLSKTKMETTQVLKVRLRPKLVYRDGTVGATTWDATWQDSTGT